MYEVHYTDETKETVHQESDESPAWARFRTAIGEAVEAGGSCEIALNNLRGEGFVMAVYRQFV